MSMREYSGKHSAIMRQYSRGSMAGRQPAGFGSWVWLASLHQLSLSAVHPTLLRGKRLASTTSNVTHTYQLAEKYSMMYFLLPRTCCVGSFSESRSSFSPRRSDQLYEVLAMVQNVRCDYIENIYEMAI